MFGNTSWNKVKDYWRGCEGTSDRYDTIAACVMSRSCGLIIMKYNSQKRAHLWWVAIKEYLKRYSNLNIIFESVAAQRKTRNEQQQCIWDFDKMCCCKENVNRDDVWNNSIILQIRKQQRGHYGWTKRNDNVTFREANKSHSRKKHLHNNIIEK